MKPIEKMHIQAPVYIEAYYEENREREENHL